MRIVNQQIAGLMEDKIITNFVEFKELFRMPSDLAVPGCLLI